MLSPLFLQVVYRMPGFPVDTYGFTLEDRLRWAPYAQTYLTNNAGSEFLADLRFDNGRSLFNERELSHMKDVKVVTKAALNLFYGALAALALIGLWSRRPQQLSAFLDGLRRGGWIMVGLAGAVAIVVLTGMFLLPNVFWSFFAGFHAIFFEGIRGYSNIPTPSSACSHSVSGRIRSYSQPDLQWREDWARAWNTKTAPVSARNMEYA